MKLKIILWITIALVFVSCDIKDEVPYPIVYGQITEFEVEGQCGADGTAGGVAAIDKTARTVTVYVSDTVNVSSLKIKRIGLSGMTYNPDVDYNESPMVCPDSSACINYALFPKTAFAKVEDGRDTRVNFTHEVKFVVRTYQDYVWTVKVHQVLGREIEVENQIGQAVIDPYLCNAIVYVSREQSLKKLKVKKFTLGGTHGAVTPDPTTYETYDFYNLRRFIVKTGWGKIEQWSVLVCHTDEVVETTAKVLPRNLNATVSGTKPNGVTPKIEYRDASTTEWRALPATEVKTTATTYTATIGGLRPSTKYMCRVTAGDVQLEQQEFSTVSLQQIPNSSFDDWSTDASNSKLYCPWSAGATSFWDTGNRGATTVGNSNSVPTEDTSTGSGRAAFLESKYIVLKFAAGNIFTGSYLKTDGTNGVLGFGRPFTAFPTKLTFDYKYKSMSIDKADESLAHLKGKPDSCSVYIALWHVEDNEYEDFQGEKYPLIIRTKPGKEQSLFSPDDPRVIAYGQFTKGSTVNNWTSETINLDYKNTELAPTHILVVASSSKYGDFFTGGVGSTLVVDNMKLIYE